ncbi:MAG: hypothetical protein HUU50_05185 [Candidatus Brocadiae bacterium]|nr:hypothetical protein [Candidatus Brocadiia bacterium]
MKIFILFFFSVIFFLPGCTSERIPFTQELRQEYQLSEEDLKNLQYYVSDDILIERDAVLGESKVDRGKLTTKSGKLIEQILIEEDTPGISVQSGEYWLAISFEKDAALFFTSRLGYIRQGEYYLGTRGNQRIQYSNKEYVVVNDGIESYLMIDRESLSNLIRNRKILLGRRVPLQ